MCIIFLHLLAIYFFTGYFYRQKGNMRAETILIVDDNESVLTSLELLLENEFRQIETAADPNRIFSVLDNVSVDLVILDMNFSAGINSGNEGLFWLSRILEIKPGLPVIMLTAYGDVELAVKALKGGAADFVLKPWDNDFLVEKIRSALLPGEVQRKQADNNTSTLSGINDAPTIIGQSAVIRKLLKVVDKVAKTDANVLITGENGTGKEMFAREIHRLSFRGRKEMTSVDMGAVSDTLFESELFGHEKGAFTDARESRPGKFEVANGSTLFLDEIGNLPVSLQAKLLAVLQNREVTRLGSNRKKPIDIRLIAATNCNLPEMVQQARFREDLFYRINTIQIEIPPLRNRREDIPLFVDYFFKKYTVLYKRVGLILHPQVIDKLRAYDWPGNIRELQHIIEKAVILAEKDVIRISDFFINPAKIVTNTDSQKLDEVERQAIEMAIAQSGGNLTAAAQQLGVSRQTLYNKIKRFNFWK